MEAHQALAAACSESKLPEAEIRRISRINSGPDLHKFVESWAAKRSMVGDAAPERKAVSRTSEPNVVLAFGTCNIASAKSIETE